MTSNQSSLASLRPRSAETRPGSSQLSRFAEPLSENPVAWGAAGTAEKLVGSCGILYVMTAIFTVKDMLQYWYRHYV